MSFLKSKSLFFTTSPRSPTKMLPEIKLLAETMAGRPWNKQSQEEFIDKLTQSDFFIGKGSTSDKAFSARDRINRAPKALGFIDLKPCIALTEAGHALIYGKRPHEIFLRQLLKFQLPSPYHTETKDIAGTFCIRPYLEIIRLIRELEYLTFDEFKIFVFQMTNYQKFNEVKSDILHFRSEIKQIKQKKKPYKLLVKNVWEETLLNTYTDRIQEGKLKTRESDDTSLKNFIETQKNNTKDYTDACFRYLRYTGLISISQSNKSISIFKNKLDDVDFIISNVPRTPVYIEDETAYKAYLFSASQPELYTDNKTNMIKVLGKISKLRPDELESKTNESLKDLCDFFFKRNKDNILEKEIAKIKSYDLYTEILQTFQGINLKIYYDAPLMLEYNTWRAMTMLDGGAIKGNFNFDDEGQPFSTAAGNMPDIECDYGDFSLSVEVTLQTGSRQYETEGEPVARHLGQLKKKNGKDSYCLFIAPKINDATLAHFFVLNRTLVKYYGGKSKIIPLDLNLFVELIKHSYKHKKKVTPNHIRCFLDKAIDSCNKSENEVEWNNSINNLVHNWLND